MDKRKYFLIVLLIFIIIPIYAQKDPWFGKDKLYHFTTSFSLTLWSYSYFKYQRYYSFDHSKHYAFSLSITFGIGKECSDGISGYLFKKKGKFFSVKDLIYDILGSSLAYVVINYLERR